MREIKFRGKRVGNGEWVYGWYIKATGHWHKRGIHDDWIICSAVQNGGWFTLGAKYAVTPETVGQYTGMKDKNDVEIYEGDVLHWDSHWGWYVGYENGAFRRIPLNDIQRINWRHHTLQQEGLDTWEIIGNIHDQED